MKKINDLVNDLVINSIKAREEKGKKSASSNKRKPTKEERIIAELYSPRYHYSIPRANEILYQDIDKVNQFCEEVLDLVAPKDASEEQREILMCTIARAIYASVYLEKLKAMYTDISGHTYNCNLEYDPKQESNEQLKERLANQKLKRYPTSIASRKKYNARVFRDPEHTLKDARLDKKITDMKKIPALAEHTKEAKLPHIDTIVRLKQYLLNGGEIEKIDLSEKKEEMYNDVIISAMRAWHELYRVINSDIDKGLGMSKQEIYEQLYNSRIEFAVKGVCLLERLNIKSSDVDLRKAIKNFEEEERKRRDVKKPKPYSPSTEESSQSEKKESKEEKNTESLARSEYIVKTALEDITYYIPKHASLTEWFYYITEDKVKELREAGASEEKISLFRSEMRCIEETAQQKREEKEDEKNGKLYIDYDILKEEEMQNKDDHDKVYRSGAYSAAISSKRDYSSRLRAETRNLYGNVMSSTGNESNGKDIAYLVALLVGSIVLGHTLDFIDTLPLDNSNNPYEPKVVKVASHYNENTISMKDGSTISIDESSETPVITFTPFTLSQEVREIATEVAKDFIEEYQKEHQAEQEQTKQEQEDQKGPKEQEKNFIEKGMPPEENGKITTGKKRRSDKYKEI